MVQTQEASLNGDGSLVVRRNPELRIRVVTGYTLTAAVVIKRLPTHVQEVFLVGSSEVSRGIALHLSLRGVRVLVRDERLPLTLRPKSQLQPVHLVVLCSSESLNCLL